MTMNPWETIIRELVTAKEPSYVKAYEELTALGFEFDRILHVIAACVLHREDPVNFAVVV